LMNFQKRSIVLIKTQQKKNSRFFFFQKPVPPIHKSKNNWQ
jgi:hypothetical protein